MTLLTHSERSAHDVTLVQYDNGDVVEVFAVSATVSVDEMDVRPSSEHRESTMPRYRLTHSDDDVERVVEHRQSLESMSAEHKRNPRKPWRQPKTRRQWQRQRGLTRQGGNES